MQQVTCWSFYRFRASLSLRGLIGGIHYMRCVEYPWCFNHLELSPENVLLDVGTGGSPFPSFCATQVPHLTVFAADYAPDPFVKIQRTYLRHIRDRLESCGGQMVITVQDMLHQAFPDSIFDRISCISVIEHIPHDGDSLAIRELGRLLKPGGRMVVTIPVAEAYSERYRNAAVYRRLYHGQPVFYARAYDDESLRRRLVEPSGLQLSKLTYFYEPTVPYSRLSTNRKLKPFLLPFRILNPWLASRLLVSGDALKTEQLVGRRKLACMVFTKPER